MAPLSIIIPTLNEAASLGRTLANVRALDPPALEVLVSRDATRAIQMNAGARQARGSLLCFLHADTLVPTDLVAIAERVLEDRAIAGAGFVSLMSGEDTTRWGISALNLLKTHLAPLLFRPHLYWRGLRLLLGDQVMICRRQT
ncbi:MAG: glycosyltransferase, partial [Cyanobacteria bacterium]|nr:glycosyltransferase [Cyanobacteriota bacterium]